MKAPFAYYCPACNHREQYGTSGQKLEFPIQAICKNCGAHLMLSQSSSLGIHATVESQPSH